MTRGWSAKANSSATVGSGASPTRCGCTPTTPQTSAKRSAKDRTAADWSARTPMVTMRSTPASRARATTSGISAMSKVSRWQWLSTSMDGPEPVSGGDLDLAEQRLGRRERRAARQGRRHGGEAPALRHHAELVQQPPHGARHEGLEDGGVGPERRMEVAQDRCHALGIGLLQGPGLLLRDVSVSFSHRLEHDFKGRVELLRVERLAHSLRERV